MLKKKEEKNMKNIKKIEITYHREGDYLMPNLTVKTLSKPLTRWGKERILYMKNRSKLWVESLIVRNKFWDMVLAIQDEADMMEKKLTKQLMENYNVTEELKETEWVRLTTQIRAEVEKTIMEEIICK